MMRSCCVAVGVVVALAAGCREDPVATPSAAVHKTNAVADIPGWPPVQAQPRLQTMKLYVGPEVVTVEVALTRVQLGTGMMFRKELPESEGMLFVFGVPHRAAFYMKNTTVPLTAAYLDSEGTILELHDLQPLQEEPVEAASDNIQFVLEMSQGWFQRHKVAIGSVLTTEFGRFKEAFRFKQE